MANFLIYVGQPKQAVDQVKEAIRLNPFHENWYLEYLGWAYEKSGMPKEAIGILEQVIDRDPKREQLWLLPTLAAAYANPVIGRVDDAATDSLRRFCRSSRSSRLQRSRLALLTRLRN